MSGWPNKLTRAALGPTYENTAKIANPKRQLDASILNLLAWQVAGMNGTAARGLVRCTRSGSVVTVTHQWFAWDPNQALANMTWTKDGTGLYSWALPNGGLYDDANGEEVQVELIGALPFMQGSSAILGMADVDTDGVSGSFYTYDAAVGSLTDSTVAKWLMFFI